MTFILPMFAMVIYIFGLGVYTFSVRSLSVKRRQTHIKFFKTYDISEGMPPEYVMRVGRHYDNQFQIPLLFLITLTLYSALKVEGYIPMVLSWLFVILRALHTYIHLGPNNIVYRFMSYAAGFIVLLCLWVFLAFNVLNP